MPAISVFVCVLLGGPGRADVLPYMNYAPEWSPDGRRIAFYSSRDGDWEIYTVRSDGADLTRLTSSPGYDGEPTWSPDGGRIAFASARDGEGEIFVMDVDGNNVTQLTDNDSDDDDPAWSPVEDEILFRRRQGEARYVFLMSADGKRQRKLSAIPSEGRASWSRDGREVAFVIDYRDRQAVLRVSRSGEQIDIVLTPHGFPGNPTYGPDDKSFTYDAHADGVADSGDGQWELWTVSLDGSRLRRLTDNDTDDWGGRWSADGDQLAYAGGGLDNRGYDIFTIAAPGAHPRRLTRPGDKAVSAAAARRSTN